MDRPGDPTWRREQADALLEFARHSALPDGGFGWLTDRPGVDPARPRPLFINARMTYAFALASLQDSGQGYKNLAESGVSAFTTGYLDTEHGGWFAGLDSAGRVEDATKANYAHAHALLASATATAAGIAGAPDLLQQAIDVIDRRFWRDDEGCAVESYDASFSELESYRGANSNMHSVEAYLVAGDVTGDTRWHERALSIASRLIDGHARAGGWRLPEHYDADWRPLPDYNRDRPDDQFRPFGTTPGHSFEWARLLLTVEAALPDAPAWLLEAAVGMFGTAVTDAWNVDGHEGFVYTLDPDGRPLVRERLHWVVCEAILAAHSLHRRTGEQRYADQALQWWQHVDAHFLDRFDGGWWQELAPDLSVSRTIWHGKPDLYHSYQAVLLPDLPLAPCAALALGGRSSG